MVEGDNQPRNYQAVHFPNTFIVNPVYSLTFVDSHPRYNEILPQGVDWIVYLHHNGLIGILANEMGLGKTLQTLSFLSYLRIYRDIPGTHLFVIPKPTLLNWTRDFERWTTDVKCVVVTALKEERAERIQTKPATNDFDICVTPHQTSPAEMPAMKKSPPQNIVTDEARHQEHQPDARAFRARVHECWLVITTFAPKLRKDNRR